MKYLLAGVLFLPIIYQAMKQKKWYLYLVAAFFGILPEQFSIRLHESLPLLSASRVLVMILFLFWLYHRWEKRDFSFPRSLLLFLTVNIVISIINLRYGMGEIKRIFSMVFEQVLIAVMMMDSISNREEFDRCVDFMIMGSAAVAIIGIVQNIFEYDIASVLHLTETMASIQLPTRMGMTRAYGTFNAISFGCYCAFMMLPIYYRLQHTKQRKYTVAMALNIVALICTFTRSAWLCIGAVILMMLLVYRKQFIQGVFPAAALAVVICAALCVVQPKLYNAFLETGKSVINTVLAALPEQETVNQGETANQGVAVQDAPLKLELSEDFGKNGDDPTYTRVMQWSAVRYMVEEGEALFGYGYNALPRGKIHYLMERWTTEWMQCNFLDVGLVALITESGFVGAITFLLLIAYIFLNAFRKRIRTNEFDFYKVVLYMIPLFLLLNYLAAFMFDNAVWVFLALSYSNMKIAEGEKQIADAALQQ